MIVADYGMGFNKKGESCTLKYKNCHYHFLIERVEKIISF
jgi:hypothetical protein